MPTGSPATVRWVNANCAVLVTGKTVDISAINVGEMMVILHHYGNAATANLPTGWTRFQPRTVFGSRAGEAIYKIKESLSETSVAFTGGAQVAGWSHVLLGVSNVDVSGWKIGPFWTRANHFVNDTSTLIDGVTTTEENSLALVVSFEATNAMEDPSTIVSINNGFAQLGYLAQPAASTQIETILVAQKLVGAVGDVGDTTVVYRSTQTANSAGFMIAIPPGAYVPPGLQTKMGDGRTAYVSFLNGSQERKAPARVRMLKPGFDSAEQFITTPGATMSHRGGSLHYPEMSEYAYDQSALRGYGIQEFSAQRTSDGWWFGCHNPDLNDISGNTGLPPISEMTKNQVMAYTNKKRPMAGYPSRPFFGLEDFLEKYGKDYVLMLDPKNALAYNAEFLTICDNIVDPSRLIWKWYIGDTGANNMSAGAQAALNRGWGGTWGYGYSAGIANGSFQQQAAKSAWTILGMEWDAPQSDWDVVHSFGKPTIAHICETQAQYNTAIARGADMVQCSGILNIAPVSWDG